MATRARIGAVNPDGSVTSIYTHWDGNGHLPILTKHYATEEKVRALLALGDLSHLAPELGEQHSFEDYDPDVCTAYGRDRGDAVEDVEAITHELNDWPRSDQQYEYLFEDGQWSIRG